MSSGSAVQSEQRPLTRAEVVAAVMAARQNGDLYIIEAGGTPPGHSATRAAQPTRQDVQAQVVAARRSGSLDENDREVLNNILFR